MRAAIEQRGEHALAKGARRALEQPHVRAVRDDLERRALGEQERERRGHDPVRDRAIDRADPPQARHHAEREGPRREQPPRRLARPRQRPRPREQGAAAGAVDQEPVRSRGGARGDPPGAITWTSCPERASRSAEERTK